MTRKQYKAEAVEGKVNNENGKQKQAAWKVTKIKRIGRSREKEANKRKESKRNAEETI